MTTGIWRFGRARWRAEAVLMALSGGDAHLHMASAAGGGAFGVEGEEARGESFLAGA